MPKTMVISNETTALGLAIEGNELFWTGKTTVDKPFPSFSVLTNKTHYVELFKTGPTELKFTIKAPEFIVLSDKKAELTDDKRIYLAVDWAKAPKGNSTNEIVFSGSDGSKISLSVTLENNAPSELAENLFLPENGYLSMEAPSYSRAINNRPIFWKTLPNYGKTKGGVIPVPVTAPVQQPMQGSPHLAYDIYLTQAGSFTLHTYISPTIDFTGKDGLKFAVSVNSQPPITVNINKDYQSEYAWGQSVANNIKIFKTKLVFDQPGKHTINYWMINPGVVLQKLVLDLGNLKPSYLGPPESLVSITK